jgi:hypothetical protein
MSGTLAPLLNTRAVSSPRSGLVGVLPVLDSSELEGENFTGTPDGWTTELRIAVSCPDCTNYAQIIGMGREYRNVTRMIDPVFWCCQCSWRPRDEDSTPTQWKTWYQGRYEGTMLWAVNEAHLDVLERFLEAPPKRRKRVEFGWEYRSLMKRMPLEFTSGRRRNDMVSLVKKLRRTMPRDLRPPRL